MHSNESACRKSGRLGLEQVFSVMPDSEVNMKKFRLLMVQGQEIGDDENVRMFLNLNPLLGRPQLTLDRT